MNRENQLTGAGQFLLALGLLAFLPSLFDRELLILAWLGSWQQPVGLSAIVVGGVLFGLGKLQAFRDLPPALGPTDGLPPAPADPSESATAPAPPRPAPQPNVLSNQVSVEPADRR